MMPPLITVGSSWAASSSVPISEVVVVLPCVPATATDHLSRISSPSISARRTTGMRSEVALGPGGVLPAISDRDFYAECLQPAHIGAIGDVAALHGITKIVQ